ncbi:MAG TPA: hypothetical protein VNO82_01115, partial [Solirubrobacteraceae bacterium]|nr:hypothetical protein [Solirubrobacteraceae bacterium]
MRRALALAAAILAVAPASAGAAPPWRSADTVRDALFDAQAQLILGSETSAARQVERARRAYRGSLRANGSGPRPGSLRAGVRAASPAADVAVVRALREAEAAAQSGDAVRLAAARGAARAAVLRGSFAATLAAV